MEGQGTYYQSAEAEDAYRDLIRWMRGVNAEGPVFDMAAQFESDAAEVIFPEGDAGGCWLSYLPSDVLRNRMYPNMHEEDLLEDF